MELNNNRDFYKKLFSRITFVFCLFFFIAINAVRFIQLQKEPLPEPPLSQKKPLYLHSAVFQKINDRNQAPKIVFLQNSPLASYLSSALSFIEKYPYRHVFFVNCTQGQNLFVKQYFEAFFPNMETSEIPCNASFNEFKQKAEEKNLILTFVFETNQFKHENILNVAEKLALKPYIQTSEIKDEN